MDFLLAKFELLLIALCLFLKLSLCRPQADQLFLIVSRELCVSHLFLARELLDFPLLLLQAVEIGLLLIKFQLNFAGLILEEGNL